MIIQGAIGQLNSIANMYDQLADGCKRLGKMENQIAGMKKQSMAQSMRWGMF